MNIIKIYMLQEMLDFIDGWFLNDSGFKGW